MAKQICAFFFCFWWVLFCLGHIATADDPVTIFIFGDSTVDVGTNNLLQSSSSRADFAPYGIDFPYSVPTGRFSNGLNSADQLARLFGYQRSPPPFLYILNRTSTFKRDILQGVNFASGGSGILIKTGKFRYTEVVPLGDQIQQFATVRGNFIKLIGPEATDKFIAKSLFIVSTGSNDLFDHVELPSNSSTSVDPEDEFFYMANLQSTYRNHLEGLYKLGARKFGIISVAPIGCCPHARVSNTSGVCREELNKLAQSFFISLQDLLLKMSSKLKGMKYSLGNAYAMTMSIIEDPLAFGFKDTQSACCGNGQLNGVIPCMHSLNPNLCANRHEYLFWDLYHPTEYASRLAALTLYGAGTRFVAPMNFSQLAAIPV
ncbi:PREDICTED: GDSL esterase/lipase At4g16230-like [Prunus mume]|uniref:GDSL esterase/lipase At4g16230-like n=1 Tax=Prunus mume TaxID=102107 RepID=A0ABM0PNC6_PRUMU|nr:PREDICTED: GDSL esterase/lipase At4g16230-like [Prunus mume]